MIFDATQLPSPLKLKTDLCIIGSGAGGSMVAMIAAQAGKKVLVLEAGSFITPDKMNQREESMIPRLFCDSGSRTTIDRKIKIYQGKGIGGSTLHNINLCKRIPNSILKTWIHQNGLYNLSLDSWDKLYNEVESILQVSEISEMLMNKPNALLKNACDTLGWKGGMLKHNRSGCMQSGFCEVGCAFDAKNNACKVLVPKAVEAGAEFITHCRAVRIIHEKNQVKGIDACVIDPITSKVLSEMKIECKQICISASATETPALIKRSAIPFPDKAVGETLHLHPGVAVAGDFDESIYSWKGIPQSYECTEFLKFDEVESKNENLSSRIWIITAFAHPMGTATSIPGHGKQHLEYMKRYSNLAVFSAMLHDESCGTITPKNDTEIKIDYQLNESDKNELYKGMINCAQLLFASGAKKVIVPSYPIIELNSKEDLKNMKPDSLKKIFMDITAVHPMGSVPMGEDKKRFAVNSQGKYMHMEGLWIADGSLFPSSIGVPPQLSIYALGMHVGRKIAAYM